MNRVSVDLAHRVWVAYLTGTTRSRVQRMRDALEEHLDVRIEIDSLRPGDEFEFVSRHRVGPDGSWDAGDHFVRLVDRPNPDAALHAAVQEAADGAFCYAGDEWAAAFVEGLHAAGFLIEPTPKDEQ